MNNPGSKVHVLCNETKYNAASIAAGRVTGYLGMKVGKMAAMTLGGSLLVMQVANHKGYINVNWAKVNNDIREISEKVQDDVKSAAPGAAGEVSGPGCWGMSGR